MSSLVRIREAAASIFTEPIVKMLVRTNVTPNALTWFGFALALVAAVFIALEYLFVAGIVLLTAGLFDLLDGALARRTNKVTIFGGVLDSTLDRLSEGVILLGIIFLYTDKGSSRGVLLAAAVLLTSLLVSYIRAKAEATGIKCMVGLFTRPERVIILALGLLLNWLEIALAIVTVFSFITVGQRLIHVWCQVKDKRF